MSNEQRTALLAGLITETAVAVDLDVEPRTVDRYTKRAVDPLPYLRIGMRKYFDVEVVRKWVMRQTGPKEVVPRGAPRKHAMKSQTTAKRGRGRPRKDEQRAAG